MKFRYLLVVSSLLFSFICTGAQQTPPNTPTVPELPDATNNPFQAAVNFKSQGNYKDALKLYRQLLNDKKFADKAGYMLDNAVDCMRRLNQVADSNQLVEDTLKVFPNNFGVLRAAANYYHHTNHTGIISGNKFIRGWYYQIRTSGRRVNSLWRDRVKALRLYRKALTLTSNPSHSSNYRKACQEFANCILLGKGKYNRYSSTRNGNTWRLQNLTDLNKLPDYDPPQQYYGSARYGAPVDSKGNPVFYYRRDKFEECRNDGERWRWALGLQYGKEKADLSFEWRNFLSDQFSVSTLMHDPTLKNNKDAFDRLNKIFSLNKLSDDETVALTTDGIKRFKLPPEFNFITLGIKRKDYHNVISEYLNRLQYSKALEFAQKYKDKVFIELISANRGAFLYSQSEPSGMAPTLKYVYRNAKEVKLTATRLDGDAILNDMKDFLRSNPLEIDQKRINLGYIGYRLVKENQNKFLIKSTTKQWTQKLDPGTEHYRRVIDLKMPFKQPGAYLVKAEVSPKSISYIIVWLTDTLIIRNQYGGEYVYIAVDAITGKPLENAEYKFFSFNVKPLKKPIGSGKEKRRFNVICKESQHKAPQGMTSLKPTSSPRRGNLLVEVSSIGNRGIMGFNSVWYSRYSGPAEYNQRKIFCTTDRPVYRPGQTVKFKAWGAQVSYIKELNNPYAGAPLGVIITSPDGTKIFNKTLTADEFGGVDGEVKLPKGAKLGNYNIRVGRRGYRSFRVEEYKKPEFEVIVEGPDKPLLLGDKFKVNVTAKYYFGQPVKNAKVTYKVERRQVDKILYPWHYWDWLYGNGYWWNSVYWSYDWLPGYNQWCIIPVYYPWMPRAIRNNEVIESGTLDLHEGKASIEINSDGLKQLYGDIDSEYTVNVSVTDESRRLISGSAKIQVPAKPFNLFVWPHRGFYYPGDVVRITTEAISPTGQKVEITNTAELYKIKFDKNGKVSETKIGNIPGSNGKIIKFKAVTPGLYKIQCTASNKQGNKITSGCIVQVIGEKPADTDYRFNELELHTDKQTYEAGNTVKLLINTRQKNATVFLLRSPGKEIVPEIITMKGQSIVKEFKVTRRDMPNCFVKAFTVVDGRIYQQQLEIRIPPDNKVINVEVTPAKTQIAPGKMTAVNIKLTNNNGTPVNDQIAVTVYDKSVEYIAQSNIPDIRKFFWNWQHHYYNRLMTNLLRFNSILEPHAHGVNFLGCFDNLSNMITTRSENFYSSPRVGNFRYMKKALKPQMLAYAAPASAGIACDKDAIAGGASFNDVKVRSEFADTAYWAATLTPDKNGNVQITFKAPENLTTWKVKVWAMSKNAQVGQGEAEFITSKDFLLRLQTPRFLVESDQTVISANIHSYRKTGGKTSVQLSFEGDSLKLSAKEKEVKTITIPAGGEARVDWNVDAIKAGKASVTVKAVTDGASDAMQLKLPVIVHGITKQVAASGKLAADAPDSLRGTMIFELPKDRKPEASRLQINFSPTLAGAILDALPYLVGYPYGCTEQTLNRFLPTIFVKKTLQDIGITLPEINDKRTNLNAAELGDDKKRAEQWKRYKTNPVFNQKELDKIVKAGITRLDDMQNRDGGWGWFSGYEEHSYPHTTAQIVRGLLVAKTCGTTVKDSMLNQGVKWLENYQQEQIKLIENYPKNIVPKKEHADNLDAFVFMVLVKAGKKSPKMQEYLYRDRAYLSVYSLSLFGIALEQLDSADQLKMVMNNIRQYVKVNNDNQTAWLNMAPFCWWFWYGSETEAMASYIKLLCARGMKVDMETASKMVKYLLNNRKHATYWNSTRDTALCAEALCIYLKKSGEMSPNMTVNIFVDGKQRKTIKITKDNLFSYDSSLILRGNELTSGKHKIEISRTGKGPLYYNGYLSYFSKEKFITKTGLDIKIIRNYYLLRPITVKDKEQGLKQVVTVNREKYKRTPVKSPAEFKSGDIFEVELIVNSSNDYEYIMLTDFKPAGAEAMDVRSGYTSNSSLWPYMEFRDTKVCMFVRRMPRGKHSITYRLRAETPGKYSALPAKAEAMYAPELKANSNERKVGISE